VTEELCRISFLEPPVDVWRRQVSFILLPFLSLCTLLFPGLDSCTHLSFNGVQNGLRRNHLQAFVEEKLRVWGHCWHNFECCTEKILEGIFKTMCCLRMGACTYAYIRRVYGNSDLALDETLATNGCLHVCMHTACLWQQRPRSQRDAGYCSSNDLWARDKEIPLGNMYWTSIK
jgi:hypothetical protein